MFVIWQSVRRSVPCRLLLILGLGALSAGIAFAIPPGARGQANQRHRAASAPTGLNIKWFSMDSACSRRIDPITVIYDPYGEYQNVGLDVSRFGWSESVLQPDRQYFWGAGVCD